MCSIRMWANYKVDFMLGLALCHSYVMGRRYIIPAWTRHWPILWVYLYVVGWPCQVDLMSGWRFVGSTLCRVDVLSGWHFVIFTFCQVDIFSGWHFVRLTFCQVDVLSLNPFMIITVQVKLMITIYICYKDKGTSRRDGLGLSLDASQ